MSKPAFWLKITPTYVIENFDELQNYVNAYDYSYPEDPESDFNRTVNYLSEVARGIIAICDKCNVDDMPVWDMEPDKALRIVATAIVAERKRDITAHDMIVGLMRMLLFTYKVPSEYKRSFLKNLNACARKSKLRSMSISLPELMPDRFSQARLCSGVADLTWNTAVAPLAYYEGKGTVLFSNEGIEITPMNHDKVIETSNKRRLMLEVSPTVRLTDAGARRISRQTLPEMIDGLPLMLHEFENVKPSRERKIKEYAEGDYLDVRVKKISLPRIECETIDPAYKKITGKIMLDAYNLGVLREYLQSQLKVGDILPAVYNPADDCVFGISRDSEEESNFKHYVWENHLESMMRAVWTESYSGGTRWLSETGILVNVPNWKEHNVNLSEHMRAGACVKVRICEITFDRKGNVVANGEFADEIEQTLPDVDFESFVQQANMRLAQSLITFMENNPEVEIHEGAPEVRTTESIVDTLGLLMMRNAGDERFLTSAERIGYIVAGEALFICTQAETDMLVARRELSYHRAVIAFAMGESPVSLSLSLDDRIATHAKSFEEMNIIDILRDYKETHHAIKVADSLMGEQPGMIGDLVRASNTLIDKIDMAELSRIKKAIAVKLGAGDMFREIYHNHTYYGVESDTLEFKISCVRPPANRQTGTFEGDMQMQQYTIFKTVCAFLNSPSGGDLLIGVNDDGYGVGVRGDIELLHDNHVIPEANADRLRVYIKNRIDQAFVSNDGNVSGNAITVGNVLVNIETTKEGAQILRVKVNPYPYDVVRIRKDLCPAGYKDVFFRSSGASEPLDSSGVRNVRMQKLQSLDPNDSKIAMVLEAIDNKMQLRIGRYISRHESTNRIIEPHRLMMGNTSLQAYDRATNQMRLFKLSRIDGLERVNKRWEAERKHRSWPVDVFGMMQSEKNQGEMRRIKMTKFAKILINEEYPMSLDDSLVTWSENTDADRGRFPVVMETMVYNEGGMQRFLLGLPEETLLVAEPGEHAV